MCLPFIKTAEPISSQRLQNAHVNIGIVVMQKWCALYIDEATKFFQIEIKQLLPQLRRKIGLRIVEKGRDVVLQRPFAPTLIVQKKRLPVFQHDVTGLKVAVEKIIAVCAQ